VLEILSLCFTQDRLYEIGGLIHSKDRPLEKKCLKTLFYLLRE